MAHAGLRGPWSSAKFTVVRLTNDQILENATVDGGCQGREGCGVRGSVIDEVARYSGVSPGCSSNRTPCAAVRGPGLHTIRPGQRAGTEAARAARRCRCVGVHRLAGRPAHRRLTQRLDSAAPSRSVIGQAMGCVMQQQRWAEQEAFNLPRQLSQLLKGSRSALFRALAPRAHGPAWPQ
ncbi:ANTAR domain-containing protein [Streptomyces sp. NPDC004533]|uniref:ANTAR domain-containing protein n=1 Tax=Streptomyces sp. NPDC004533 TaxID=3154278 RepID=UPI0033ADD892